MSGKFLYAPSFKKKIQSSFTLRDTVSSVGIIPRTHPYTSVNYAVKTFRHALALDERRARFRPKTWYETSLEQELDLDVDEPDIILRGSTSRDDWVYTPSKRDVADVKEVWFSGKSIHLQQF